VQSNRYYQTKIERRSLSPGGLIRAGLAAVDLYIGSADIRANYVQVLTLDGKLVREFAYRWDYQGAAAMLALINEDLVAFSKERFDQAYEIGD
jgi:hypothetical protein